MKNKILIGLLIAIIIIIVVAIALTMILDKKGKFIGTWQYSAGGTITFYDDNTVNIVNIGPLGDLQLLGVFEYKIVNNQIIFNSGSLGVTLNYSFSNSNTLILSNDAGLFIILNKLQ